MHDSTAEFGSATPPITPELRAAGQRIGAMIRKLIEREKDAHARQQLGMLPLEEELPSNELRRETIRAFALADELKEEREEALPSKKLEPPQPPLLSDGQNAQYNIKKTTDISIGHFQTGPSPSAIAPPAVRISNWAFADALYNALHVRTARYQVGLEYPTKLEPISLETFRQSLDGEFSIALSTVTKGRASFAAHDIDSFFPQRLPVVLKAIRTVGGEILLRSCFITEGSKPNRGKIIMLFEKPVSRTMATLLAKRVHDTALRDPHFIPIERGITGQPDPHIYETRPTDGKGGLCRVLGRNVFKDGPIERASDVDGALISTAHDLKRVIPLSEDDLRRIVHPDRPAGRKWFDVLTENEWTWERFGGHTDVFSKMVAVAHEVAREFGASSDGERQCRATFDAIKRISPDMDEPSPKSGDTRNPLDWDRSGKAAWQKACSHPKRWTRLNLVGDSVPRKARVLYNKLCDESEDQGFPPGCFTMSQLQMADLLEVSDHKTARRWLKQLIALGLAVEHVPGRRGAGGNGRSAVIGIVGQGETAQDLCVRYAGDHLVLSNKADRLAAGDRADKRSAGKVKVAINQSPDDENLQTGWRGVKNWEWRQS